MTTQSTPQPLHHTFTATIDRALADDGWHVVVMPNSREFFGTGRTVKVVATIDEHEVTTSFMPTGNGGHMLPIKAAIRKAIDKEVGQEVTVHLLQRLS